jgi:hypothetical protein
MLPFLYDPKRKREKEKFVQEELRIEEYIQEPLPEKKKKEEKDTPDRGVSIMQL